MRDVLQGLVNIPGVIGSAVFGPADECLDHIFPPPYEPTVLTAALREIRSALGVLAYLEGAESWNALVLRFDLGYVVVRASGSHVVMVLGQPTLNPAMLSVGFNIALQKMAKLPAQSAAPVPVARTGTMPAAVPRASGPQPAQAAPMSQTPPTQPARPAATRPSNGNAPPPLPRSPAESQQLAVATSQNTQVSQSNPGSNPGLAAGSAAFSSSDAIEIMPDAVERAVMDALLKALARHIGPFAKMAMKEELTRLGASHSTLEQSRYEDLLGGLARRVTDPNKRREFVTEAEKLGGTKR